LEVSEEAPVRIDCVEEINAFDISDLYKLSVIPEKL
jgi:hypothetical protein